MSKLGLSICQLWCVLALLGVCTIGAEAAVIYEPSRETVAHHMVARTDALTHTGPWQNLPGASVTLISPSNYVVTARFSGESGCFGDPQGWCSMRILAWNRNSGVVLKLNPAVDLDYHFDAVQSILETHTMERFLRLYEGQWTIYAQWATSSDNVRFWLDDWTFAVDLNG